MHIEVQFTADAFLAALLARLRDTPVVVPNIFDFLQHGPCVVDRLVLGEPSLTKLPAAPHLFQVEDGAVSSLHVPGFGVILPVEVRIATVAAVKAGGDAGPAEHVAAPTVNITFRLSAQMVFPEKAFYSELQDPPYAVFSLKYEGKDLALPDAIEGDVNARLTRLGRDTVLPVRGLASLLTMPAPLQNVGLAGKADLSAVCLRLEVVDIPHGATARWEDFFAGNFIVRLAGREWALFIDGALLALAAQTKVAPHVSKTPDKFRLSAGPSAHWGFVHPGAKGYGGFGIVTTFEGNAIDACPQFGINIGVDVRIDVGFRLGDVDGSAVIDSRTRVTWDLTDSDVLWCGLAIGVVWGSVIGIFGGPVGLIIGAVAGALLGPIIVAIVSDEIDAPQEFDIASRLGDHCTKLETDPDESIEAVCLEPIEIPNGALLDGLTPSAMLTDPSGLTLVGGMPPLPPVGDLKTQVTGGFYTSSGNCSTLGLGITTHPGKIAAWSQIIRADGTAYAEPSRIAMAARLQDDPQAVWRLSPPSHSQPWLAAVTVSWGHGNMEAYRQDPYPLQAIVLSSRGARWVVGGEVPPDPDTTMTPEEKLDLINQCNAKSDGFWNATGRFKPDWHVNPPWERERGRDVIYDWRILVRGLSAEERVTVLIGDSPVMHAAASARGIAVIELVVPGEGGEAVAIERQGRQGEGIGEQRMAVEQALMSHERSFSTTVGASDLRLMQVDGKPFALVSGGDGASLYAVGQSRRGPLLRVTGEPVTTTAVAGREVLLGGPDGLTRLTLSARSRPRAERVSREPVRELRMDGGELRIVTASDNPLAAQRLSRLFRTAPERRVPVPVRRPSARSSLSGVWIGRRGPDARFLRLNHERASLDVYALTGRGLM
ncbi:MAG: hypothetical protein KY456_16055 [Chloroflexi bacterium]|nr:hypothetical protein [Chloroflexota bacterium]